MKTDFNGYQAPVSEADRLGLFTLGRLFRAPVVAPWLALGLIVAGVCETANAEPGTTRAIRTAGVDGIDAHPLRDQSVERQRQDRSDCRIQSVGQTGFEPSAGIGTDAAPTRIIYDDEARRPRSPAGSLTGAGGGAALGAASGAVAGEAGAAVGAAVGAVAGLIAAARAPDPETASTSNVTRSASTGQIESRRAIAACLRERGYDVHLTTQ